MVVVQGITVVPAVPPPPIIIIIAAAVLLVEATLHLREQRY